MELQTILEKKNGTNKARKRKLKPVKTSKRAEIWYRDKLTALINTLVEQVNLELEAPNLTDSIQKSPNLTAKISRALQRAANWSLSRLAFDIASGFADRTNRQNKGQVKRMYKNAFGIDLTGFLSDEVTNKQIEESIVENVNLIESIKTDFINDIGSVVFQNLKDGGRSVNLSTLIKARGKVSKNRAIFIARDQTAKLNSSLNEIRSVSLGLDMYEWIGAGDARERDSHYALNGKICKYSDPTVFSDDKGKTWKKRKTINAYEGNPGTDFQCRCSSAPFVSWD